jgi:hypothetical protein
MSFVKVAKVSEIPAGTMKHIEAGGEEICIANVSGKFYASVLVVAAFASLIAAVYVPYLQGALRTTSQSAADWAAMLLTSVLATFWMELAKLVSSGHRKSDISSMR